MKATLFLHWPIHSFISSQSFTGASWSAGPSGRIWKSVDHRQCIGRVWLQYAFDSVSSTHLTWQISIHIPPRSICRAFHLQSKAWTFIIHSSASQCFVCIPVCVRWWALRWELLVYILSQSLKWHLWILLLAYELVETGVVVVESSSWWRWWWWPKWPTWPAELDLTRTAAWTGSEMSLMTLCGSRRLVLLWWSLLMTWTCLGMGLELVGMGVLVGTFDLSGSES